MLIDLTEKIEGVRKERDRFEELFYEKSEMSTQYYKTFKYYSGMFNAYCDCCYMITGKKYE